MASYKNQHFVPRCYLKPFSAGGRGRAIHVYNLERRLAVKEASLRGQCAAPYFYGKDLELEKILKFSEDCYANVLKNIVAPGRALTELDRAVLRHFCYLQNRRVEATLRRMSAAISETNDVAYDGDVPSQMRITMRDAVEMGMRMFANTMHVIDDLKVCLVSNKTRRPFITSDNPAVLTNRWYLQNSRARGLSGGIGNAGALFFLPLTPELLCLIYDGDVYSVSNAGGWIGVSRPADIDAFNEHQILACLANIYFADWKSLPELESQLEAAVPNRPAVRHEITTAVLEREDEEGELYRVIRKGDWKEGKRSMVHVRTIDPNPNSWPSIIRWRSNPKIYSNGTASGFVRRSIAEEYSRLGDPIFQRIR